MLHSRRITFPEFDRKQFHISYIILQYGHYMSCSFSAELPDVLNAPANSVKDINITASPVATHPTNDATLTAAPAATEMMNVAAADSSAMPVNNVNESSARVEESEKKLVMGSGYQSIPSGQHVVCRPWNPGMTLPEDAEMLFRDDRFIAYRVVKQ